MIHPPRRAGTRVAAGLTGLVLFVALVALGTWQVQRRAWKHALIAQVDARIHAAPVAAPGPDRWAAITADTDAYRRVRVAGRFVAGKDTLVQAATALGSGHWVMAPLRTDRGFIVLVNRGFVPPDRKATYRRATGSVTVTGLLRISEPEGGFLRRNDPAADRWYSRDVAAIATARGLGPVAPYFIDAEQEPDARTPVSDAPVAGLTVVAFPDNHLVYALTWYGLATMLLIVGFLFGKEAWRDRRQAPKSGE